MRFSRRACRRRIVVRPGKVEIVAPLGDRESELHRLIDERRQWIFSKLEVLKDRTDRLHALTSYALRNGTKIPYRGRLLSLEIHPTEKKDIGIEYRTGFRVYRPAGAADEELRNEFDMWLRDRLLADAVPLVRRYSILLDVKPGRISIRDMKTRWGSCGGRGDLSFNLKLIHLPRDLTEYVVAHELCHLRHRDHSRRFWDLLDSVLPARIPRHRRIEGCLLQAGLSDESIRNHLVVPMVSRH
ncbi:MAG: M48 family metallopeptidase [Candidatus Fermentibacteraceae bacterium]|nr:M48 family metallopeptidase [Candidatus Fermentibacteraceae bacterium]